MEKSKRFTDLIVWQKAHQFVLSVYNMTKSFPREELFGLTSQIRRSAVSIVANIVEGSSRQHTAEFIQMLFISKGSLEETKYYLLLGKELNYINEKELENAEGIGKLKAKGIFQVFNEEYKGEE